MSEEKIVTFSGKKYRRGFVAEIVLEVLASIREKDPDNMTPAEVSLLTDKVQAAYDFWTGPVGTPSLVFPGQLNEQQIAAIRGLMRKWDRIMGKSISERLLLEIKILRRR